MLVRGGFDVPAYLGSAATFTLGGFGGHGGRALQTGDVLHLAPDDAPPLRHRPSRSCTERPVLTSGGSSAWSTVRTARPTTSPTTISTMFFATDWSVHYNSSRTGVRLVGPEPEWARADGGEAGLHPSNIHDTPYTVGAVDFTGDMPILLGPDGPSLGGFVCPVTVTSGRAMEVGTARARRRRAVRACRRCRPPRRLVAHDASMRTGVLAVRAADGDVPQVTYRRSGDRAVLVEYGPMVLDLDLRLRAHALAAWVADAKVAGVVEVTPGIRSLQVQVDGDAQTVDTMLDVLRAAEDELPSLDDVVVASRTVHLPLSWDDPATREAIERYMRSVRDDAPWCPWNIEFIRRINGLDIRRRRPPHRVRRRVPRARAGRRVPRRAGRGAGRSPPSAGHHEVQPRAYVDAGERGRDRGRVPVRLRDGRARAATSSSAARCRCGAGTARARISIRRLRGCCASSTGSGGIRSTPTPCSRCAAEARAGRLELDVEDGEFSRADYRAALERDAGGIDAFRRPRAKPRSTPSAPHGRRAGSWRGSTAWSSRRATSVAEDALGGPLPDHAVVVEASMHACVWRLDVAEGDVVAPGTVLVSMEAMKLETTVPAPVGGTVSRVLCRVGQVVAPGAPLVVLVADD